MLKAADHSLQAMIPAWINGALVPANKLAVHLNGDRHLAVSVFVVAGDAILLQKRAAGKYHTPGLWANTCCTHPHWQERTVDCAVRRLEEELAISGVVPEFRQRVSYCADVGGGMTENEVVDVFVATADSDLAVTPNPDEVSAVRWIGLAELDREIAERPERFTPWLRIYLAEHRSQIFG